MTRQPAASRDRKHRVAGEDPHVLLPLLQKLVDSMIESEDGTFRVEVTYGPSEGSPLARALMRVEAELLLEDARRVGSAEDPRRSAEGRRHDALLLLALRTTAALGHPADPALLKRLRRGTHVHTHRGVA
jgi:hypothetical protein